MADVDFGQKDGCHRPSGKRILWVVQKHLGKGLVGPFHQLGKYPPTSPFIDWPRQLLAIFVYNFQTQLYNCRLTTIDTSDKDPSDGWWTRAPGVLFAEVHRLNLSWKK